jgi:hypothetical protein
MLLCCLLFAPLTPHTPWAAPWVCKVPQPDFLSTPNPTRSFQLPSSLPSTFRSAYKLLQMRRGLPTFLSISPHNEENKALPYGSLPFTMQPTCPSHLSLFTVLYADSVAIPHDSLICAFLCRSHSLILRQLVCTRSSICNCSLVKDRHSLPNSTIGRTVCLVTVNTYCLLTGAWCLTSFQTAHPIALPFLKHSSTSSLPSVTSTFPRILKL